MKLDETIIKCFEELIVKANNVAGTERQDSDGWRSLDEEQFFEWSTSVMSLFDRLFESNSPQVMNFKEQFDRGSKAYYEQPDCLKRCKGILLSAYTDYKSGYLFKIKSLVSAEVLDNIIEQAEELLKAGYKDPACVITGVALETTLRKICTDAGIVTDEKTKANKMNDDLAKAGKYNLFKQKQVTAWLDLRNKAAHGQWEEYNETDVRAMIDGVNTFIADYL
ncbi:MAG: hypothetical protein A2104_09155 [Candidatus Melainabacteria bacterium GWF2_32_7]|nr:MAG: hypothetical protein A2104_09155 [Candidatus Melainabacteria bacterium GWF2_32_7]